MNIQSMTGYGTAESNGFRVEARSINHKYLYVQLGIPQYLYCWEHEIRKMVKDKFKRGYIEIFFSRLKEDNIKVRINTQLAREYYQAFLSLKRELQLKEDIGIDLLLAHQKDIFSFEDSAVEFPAIRDTIDRALEGLKQMRISEGEVLVNDIKKRMHALSEHTVCLENIRHDFTANAQKLLTERLREFLGDTLIDDARIVQEVAILIEKTDITEEIIRIKSHLKQMEDTFAESGEVGRKLGFLVQELHRELNTIGSKAFGAGISARTVEMKCELEKIREQAQNLQ